ncbi:hypothetical protein [Polaribacter ponticola]|uniref:Uncharacterized protein n=1 Tax=Polaribacter ponticola TaxID=2978475 RepID=A0ABT5SBF9_9FLAO|nr:hypothetical protein [Polaribacter sp. MSW5]MDD7915463.1 hypothetical protein [Polaribacter sp. MSW5]
MELTKEQLLQIDNYVFVCGIKYYDVRTEIVDHFANILEQKLDKNPNINFKREIENIHRNFSDRGFSNLLKEKRSSVTKKFYKQSFKHLISFFKFPKIIITGVLFYSLTQIQILFIETQDFFEGLFFVSVLLMFVILFRAFRRTKKETFLTLSMTLGFYQFYHIFVIFLQSSYSRSIESLTNSTHNNIFIACYVLLFLFFWCGESVYHQNKKLVKEQYPNILV